VPGHILMVFGSQYGQTAKIAARMRDVFESKGWRVSLFKGDVVLPDLRLDGFSGVIIGASVIRHRHQRYIERFVRSHRDVLNRMPSAFFSVSGAAGGPMPDGPIAARQIMRAFLQRTGWSPSQSTILAGAISFTKYNPLVRLVMKRISRKAGGFTDTSRDHEYTDWSQVTDFVDEFAERLRSKVRDEVPVGV
jgi:menaquinone-dependent protoporphyrinogen oxidase